ncbi:uncharacterized protein [Amphiura filiformis]|uniref:uncharacterized protein isoform X2 n=1 Tax=Amphiura filiformis TaxID=82378 RepID=UPI003B214BEF
MTTMEGEQKMTNVELSDINPSNGTNDEEHNSTNIHTFTVSSQNGFDSLQPSDSKTDGDLQSRRNRKPVASFHIQNGNIDHDMCHVALQQEGELEHELEKEEEKREEVTVSSPMMLEKPREMRPYSVALEVMFKKKELKSKRRRMCLIALAILLAVLLLGGIVAVLVIYVGGVGGPEPEPVAIQGEFRIANMNYSDAFSNPQSTEYKQLKREFINEMDKLYMNSTFKNLYINTQVSGFREGSVIVAFVVQLKRTTNEITDTKENDDNEVDDDTNQTEDDRNQPNPIYREARDFIFMSVDNGMLGNFQGTVINLTLIPGRGKPVETATFPTTTTTSTATPTTTITTTTRPLTSSASVAPFSSTMATATAAVVTTTTILPPKSSTVLTTMRTTTEGSRSTDVGKIGLPADGDSQSSSLELSYSSDMEESTSYCGHNPCLHGATCVSFLGAGFCQCPDGYFGTLCESDRPPDPCEPNPCLHGGNCTTFVNTALCTCSDDYYGEFCETVSMSVPSSSYDYMYDSITPFPSIFEVPGGNVFGNMDCEPVVIQECLDILPYNKTTLPNHHGMGNTMDDIKAQYNTLSMYINSECHPEGTRVLCSLLHTKCTGETTNLFMAFLQTYTPCRSLCLEVGNRCRSGSPLEIDHLCNSLPESSDPTICFRSPDATGPASCAPEFCLNGGSCFVIMNQTFCRCPEGYIGEQCELEAIDPCLSDPCGNQGYCQTETPTLPGIPLLYICICQTGYFGKHCEHMDMANVGVVDTPVKPAECGAELLIPECANIVPYNISYSASVLGDSYTGTNWASILNQANQCDQQASLFICARMQRKCTFEGPILPCRALCLRVSSSCDLASFGLPDIGCSTYSDSLHPLDCFDTIYE